MYRVPDSDSESTNSLNFQVTNLENDLTDKVEEPIVLNSEKNSSDFESCHSQTDQIMSDQDMPDHVLSTMEQQSASQRQPEQPSQQPQQPGFTNIPNITPSQ